MFLARGIVIVIVQPGYASLRPLWCTGLFPGAYLVPSFWEPLKAEMYALGHLIPWDDPEHTHVPNFSCSAITWTPVDQVRNCWSRVKSREPFIPHWAAFRLSWPTDRQQTYMVTYIIIPNVWVHNVKMECYVLYSLLPIPTKSEGS